MQASTAKNSSGIKALLSYKGYMTKLIAYSISRFGDSLDSIAYGWMVYQLTGSKLLMGTLFAVNALPNIILSPFAGAYADRHSKKRIVVVSNLGRGIVVSLTALLFMLNLLRPWHLFVFTILNSTFESFITPANSVLNALLVPKELYLTANSFSSSAITFSELTGLALSGPIIGSFKISGAILIDGATFFISCIFIGFIKIIENNSSYKVFSIKSYFNDLKEGFIFIKNTSFVFMIIILGALVNFFITPLNVLEPVFVKDILKGGPEAMSYLGVGFMTGSILGGIIISQIGSKFKPGRLITWGIGIFGINYCLLSIPGNINFKYLSPIFLAAIIYFLMGFTLPVANAPLSAYMMSNTPKELMGKVSSVMGTFCMCMMPLGSAISGAVSEYVPIPVLFLSTGIIIALISFLVSFNKSFKNS